MLNQAIGFGLEGIYIKSFLLPNPFTDDIKKLNNMLDQHHIELIWAWGHPSGFKNGQNILVMQGFKKHALIAKPLGAKVIRICDGGHKTRPNTSEKIYKRALIPLLAQVTDFAIQHDPIIALENHSDLHADEIVDVVETIDSNHFGICLDTANNLRMLEDPWEAAIQKMAPYAKATHTQAFQVNPTTFSFWPSVVYGQGSIPLDKTFQLLHQLNYHDLLAIEIDYLHPRHPSEQDAIRQSLDYLKQLKQSTLDLSLHKQGAA
ncbi:sugar phosphate isomerase/epimerase family protein [Acinetobacter sp. ANC 5414]|uniref:sugar phosphate isomerase/epimerase family protein n=1 Tax=Acinetobacter sp. ANC 5414 TaxID=2731251 RepID=UPI0020304AD6|nr:sugar phosphate isomerase/epimerase family protein [Acinetobacter sp. ANC 5414]